ncbi:hypothetical protein EJD97_021068, partial [Solanum chilense]
NKESICWKSVKTRLSRRTSRRIVMVTTDRHGLRHPILVQFLLLLSSLPSTASMTDLQDGPSPVQLSVEGVRSKTLKLLEYGYWDYFSELHDEPAGWTIIDTTDRHGLRNPTLGQTSPSSFSNYTTLPPTDRHKHDGPSQAP